MKKPVKILLAACSLFVSCAAIPVKPIVEVCVPQITPGEEYCLCGMSNSDSLESKPISYCDKATAFPPDSWKSYHTYVNELELYIKNNCSK